MSNTELYHFLKKDPSLSIHDCNVDGKTPLIFYLMSKNRPVKIVEYLLSQKVNVNNRLVDWEQWLTTLNPQYLPLLLKHGLNISLSKEK